MFLVVGLGNFGKEYDKTRHNVGFLFVDYVMSAGNFQNKFDAEICKTEFKGEKVIFAKPLTYMNLSGKSVGQICRFYKIPPEKVIVVYDDLDLPLAKVKFKTGGGAAGHNGIKSLDAAIGKNYHRVRVGIDRPEFGDVSAWVLKKFSKDEYEQIENALWRIESNLEHLFKEEYSEFQQKVNI